ncbi:hypothetical protein A2U01_0031131 [Trifolium medium]|uniref:Uncharacterized protein n=1 Tax=Trifolium medium TaxID=97028 RepID=A0A392PEZ1_9FABA|nr:hypothetical protein [Trifolium medium]
MEQNSTVAMDVDTGADKEKKIKLKMNRSKKEKAMFNFNVYIYKEASKFNKIRMKNSPLVEPDISNAVIELFPGKMAYQALYSAFNSLIKSSVEEICDENG